MTVELHFRDLFCQLPVKQVAHLPEMRDVIFKITTRCLACLSQADDLRNILCSCPPVLLVVSPVDKLLKYYSVPDVECPYTLGCIELVTGNSEHIHCQFLYVNRMLPDRLRRISV